MKKFLLILMMLVLVGMQSSPADLRARHFRLLSLKLQKLPADTPTPLPSPTPLPTPTPIPAVRIHTGEAYLLNGDFDRAREEFRIALEGAPDDETRAAALWGSARVEYEDGNYRRRIGYLAPFGWIFTPARSKHPGLTFLLGETYDALDRYGEAADSYRNYLSLRPG